MGLGKNAARVPSSRGNTRARAVTSACLLRAEHHGIELRRVDDSARGCASEWLRRVHYGKRGDEVCRGQKSQSARKSIYPRKFMRDF
jgi:hypothetical protein